MENVLTEMEPYRSMDSMTERLRYYLFEDQTFLMHRNMQTRFLSNGIAEETVNFLYGNDKTTPIADDTSRPNIYIHWYIKDANTSIELAKSQIDKATILGVTDDHGPFTEQVLAWLRNNYDLDISEIYYEELNRLKRNKSLSAGRDLDPYLNFSSYTDSDGSTYTTQSLKALLTQDDIDLIYANNSLDLELYNYAKEKLQ
jgi:hypothetical protein